MGGRQAVRLRRLLRPRGVEQLRPEPHRAAGRFSGRRPRPLQAAHAPHRKIRAPAVRQADRVQLSAPGGGVTGGHKPRFLVAALVAVLSAAPAAAQSIGVVAPLSDAMAPLGQQIRTGAETAAAARGLAAARLHVVDDACTAEGGTRAATDLVAEGVSVVVGFACTEAIEAAMPLFAEAGIPVITPAVRTDSLTDQRAKTGWPVFRLAPRAGAEKLAIADILVPRWRSALYAIVDDGTIYGRELTESFRLAAETAGLRAVFSDTYRPQMDNQIALIGRLRRAGATHVLVGGDREDVAVMARDAADLGYPIEIVSGETLRAADGQVPLADGVLMVGLAEPAEIASDDAKQAFAARGIIPEGYMLPAFAATEIAVRALVTAEVQGGDLTAIIGAGSFDTALGPIRFDDKGDLPGNPYRLFRYQGGRFVPAD
ncbi:MAG: branched-chain amino acid ABC transporter substrate-binding protein [Rhizobiaceae bacterium]|nr:branched-chain amino acid ABC transporter substrate-binding protein [Rhizobiaceae bacterium]